MKRLLCLLAVLCLLPLGALAEDLPEQLTLAPGESRSFTLPFPGYWESDAPEVADAQGDTITAYEEGYVVLALTGADGEEFAVEIEVIPQEDEVPALIRRAIDIGIQEWTEAAGRTFPRSGNSKPHRDNKYTKWWGWDCGWCGAFANYCLDTAGVPLEPTDTYKKLKPIGSGEPHGVREAAVQKLDTGYTNMDRVTQTDPRPGYLVIYGYRDHKESSAYPYAHVGLVTDVQDLGEGKFLISTVEGNLSSRIKRFTYVYDSNILANKAKPNAKTNLNMSDAPDSVPREADIQYTPHQTYWYVTEFCMTWY